MRSRFAILIITLPILVGCGYHYTPSYKPFKLFDDERPPCECNPPAPNEDGSQPQEPGIFDRAIGFFMKKNFPNNKEWLLGPS